MSDRHRTWPAPITMITLSLIPLTAGTMRLIQLAGGPAAIAADHRFDASPLPLVLHIVGATTFALGGTLQFLPRFRRQHIEWHRRAGRVLAVAGLLVAGSALWMILAFAPKPGTGPLLLIFRLVFGSAMIGSLVRSIRAARHGDITAHQAWMIRAYAIGLAAGTQAFTLGIGGAVFGTGIIASDLAQGAGWAINLAVAEWTIRRARGRRRADPAVPELHGVPA